MIEQNEVLLLLATAMTLRRGILLRIQMKELINKGGHGTLPISCGADVNQRAQFRALWA